jgi:hypothetical protein
MRILLLIILFTATCKFTSAQIARSIQQSQFLHTNLIQKIDSIQASGIDTVIAYILTKGGIGFDLQNIKEDDIEYGRTVLMLFDSGKVYCLKLIVHPNNIEVTKKKSLGIDSSIQRLQKSINSYRDDSFLPYISIFEFNNIKRYREIVGALHSDYGAIYLKTSDMSDFLEFPLNCLNKNTRNIPDFGDNLNYEYNLSTNMYYIYSILNVYLSDKY